MRPSYKRGRPILRLQFAEQGFVVVHHKTGAFAPEYQASS